MRMLIALLAFVTAPVWAQQTKYDGFWLRNGLAASQRYFSAEQSTQSDAIAALQLSGYITGFFQVHEMNNLTASLIVGTLPKPLSAADEKKARLIFAFTPLLGLPEQITVEQAMAILRLYLEANPQKWQSGANILLTNALKDAISNR